MARRPRKNSDEYQHRSAGRQPRIARTSLGLGVFARQRYHSGQLIGEIKGQVIDDAEYSSSYCMDLGDDRCLEPAAPFRYMNHSCDPNCSFEYYDVRDEASDRVRRRMFVLAMWDIEVGEQLMIDYSWPWEMAIPCRCGAEMCRGWIVDKRELPELLEWHAEQEQQAVRQLS